MAGINAPHKIVVTSGATLVNEAIYPYPCIVHAIHVTHLGAQADWVQIHNSATVPAEGSVPLVTHAVAKDTDADIESIGWPFYFDQGVYICESDTVPTKTLHSGMDLFVTIVIEERTAP